MEKDAIKNFTIKWITLVKLVQKKMKTKNIQVNNLVIINMK